MRALERQQWVVDLSAALAEAHRLLDLLEGEQGLEPQMAALRRRIAAIEAELDRLMQLLTASGERVVGSRWPEAPCLRAAES